MWALSRELARLWHSHWEKVQVPPSLMSPQDYLIGGGGGVRERGRGVPIGGGGVIPRLRTVPPTGQKNDFDSLLGSESLFGFVAVLKGIEGLIGISG